MEASLQPDRLRPTRWVLFGLFYLFRLLFQGYPTGKRRFYSRTVFQVNLEGNILAKVRQTYQKRCATNNWRKERHRIEPYTREIGLTQEQRRFLIFSKSNREKEKNKQPHSSSPLFPILSSYKIWCSTRFLGSSFDSRRESVSSPCIFQFRQKKCPSSSVGGLAVCIGKGRRLRRIWRLTTTSFRGW